MIQDIFQQNFDQLAELPLPWEQLKGKQIFMTGATGFIGSYLIKTLCWLNHRKSLDMSLVLFHRNNGKSLFTDPCISWIEGKISEDFFPEDMKPHIIIHAASPANQKTIRQNPSDTVDCNILATHYLLEKARKLDAQVLFISSGEVYPKQDGQIVEEDSKQLANCGGRSFYGSSKLAGELLCGEYFDKYGVKSQILRAFSIFGPGEALSSGRCFTDFMRQAKRSSHICVNGPGNQTRSYCYVSDFVSGLLYVLLRGEDTVYNIGNEDNTCSILELAKLVAEVNGDTDVKGPFAVSNQEDVYIPNTTKLRALGWRPQVSLEECIKRCMDSYR